MRRRLCRGEDERCGWARRLARVARQCVIGVQKTTEDASVVGGCDEGPNRFLPLYLQPLLQRGIDLRVASVRKVGHFRLQQIVWLSFASPATFFPLGLRLLRAGRWSLFSRD